MNGSFILKNHTYYFEKPNSVIVKIQGIRDAFHNLKWNRNMGEER